MLLEYSLKHPYKLIVKILREKLWILLIAFISTILIYLFNVLLARIFPPHIYGDIILAFNIVIFLVPLVLLGCEFSTLVFIPKYLNNKNFQTLNLFLKWCRLLIIVGNALIIAIIASASLIIYFVLLPSHLDNFYHIILIAILAPLLAILVFQGAVIRAFQKVINSLFVTQVLLYALLCASLYIVLKFAKNQQSQELFFLVLGCFSLVLIILNIILGIYLIKLFKKTVACSEENHEILLLERKKWKKRLFI